MAEYVMEYDGWAEGIPVGEYLRVRDAMHARKREEVVRCRDCVHGHITINGESCKWCDLIATHDIDGNEPNNGYDPEPYFDADFFCAWGKRKEGE